VNTSLAPTDERAASLARVAERLLGATEATLESIDGGRNSRVYRLVTPRGAFALKTYFRHASDSRARMDTEFGALRFLWDQGERCVPRPIAAAADDDCAIYEWIDGDKIAEPAEAHIGAATAFLSRLHGLKNRPGAEGLRPASEACFSASALEECLRGRLEPLMARTDHAELAAFLRGQLIPALDSACARSRSLLGGAFVRELAHEHRTLSPSDFGFHNALRRPDGALVFLDLEYFGWDDPVKTICDFLLHPGMRVPAALKRSFSSSMLGEFPEAAGRMEALFPLFALKWCLILLNEFLPSHVLRRKFAGMSERDRESRETEQLAKARAMLRAAAETSPYGD